MNDVPKRSGGGNRGQAAYGVVVADNDHRVRAAMVELVSDHPGLHLVGEAVDGRLAAALCRRFRAAVAVVDVRMPHGGDVAIDAIRVACPSTVVVVYTTLADRRTRKRMLDAGAAAVIVKGSDANVADELYALAESSSASTDVTGTD